MLYDKLRLNKTESLVFMNDEKGKKMNEMQQNQVSGYVLVAMCDISVHVCNEHCPAATTHLNTERRGNESSRRNSRPNALLSTTHPTRTPAFGMKRRQLTA